MGERGPASLALALTGGLLMSELSHQQQVSHGQQQQQHQRVAAWRPRARDMSNKLASSHSGQLQHGAHQTTARQMQFQKRHRTTFNQFQLTLLEEAFKRNSYPSAAFRELLASRAHLDATRIQVWFQNRRARHKKQVNQAMRCIAASTAVAAAAAAANRHAGQPTSSLVSDFVSSAATMQARAAVAAAAVAQQHQHHHHHHQQQQQQSHLHLNHLSQNQANTQQQHYQHHNHHNHLQNQQRQLIQLHQPHQHNQQSRLHADPPQGQQQSVNSETLLVSSIGDQQGHQNACATGIVSAAQWQMSLQCSGEASYSCYPNL